jgi:soluble lytic murein transglycosylase
MISICWVPIIPGRWFRFFAAIAIFAAPPSLRADTLERVARSYRQDQTPRAKAALAQYGAAHQDASGALALLALGAAEVDQKQYEPALRDLKAARKNIGALADYAGYLAAAAEFELGRMSDVEHSLKPVWDRSPVSPLAEKATVLLANAYLRDRQPAKAAALVRQHTSDLTEPEIDSLLGHAAEASGDRAEAARRFEHAYVYFPASPEAADAASALAAYPTPSPHARLTRCLKLIDASQYATARRELEALTPQLAGADQDLARVRHAAALYFSRSNAAAYQELRALQVNSPEIEAERLYYLLQSARRLDKPEEFRPIFERLASVGAKSPWRLQALLAAADYYSVRNDANGYEPLYRACYESFAGNPDAAQCHWRVAWAEYLKRGDAAGGLFESFLKTYPDSDKAGAAMYFLGRLAELKRDLAAARAWYDEIAINYPNYYYALLARERLSDAAIANAGASTDVANLLRSISFAPRKRVESFEPSPATKARNERARLLASAALDDLADSELRYGAKMDGQPHIAAVELAELATRRDAPNEAIRYIKRYATGYMQMPVEAAPEKFWKLAFPLPFRESLEQSARRNGLDPFLLAALIRQESEFNPKAISRAHAYGLTQVLPSTGRQIGRTLNIRAFRADMLFQPETNLRIGTYFLRSLLDRLQGKWEATLASYNAGPGRVNNWLTWNQFREPAEFIESIPFQETRNYVQSVLRNADFYRRLYAPKPAKVAAK